MSDGFIAEDRLRSFVERIERLEAEMETIADDKRDVYAEAKGDGLDKTAIRQVLQIRKKGLDQHREDEAMLDLYLAAMGMTERDEGLSAPVT